MTIDSHDTAAAIHSSAAQLLRKLGTESKLLHQDLEQKFSRETWSEVSAAGWFDMLLPSRFGGLGLGFTELGAVFRAVGAHLCEGPLYEHAVVAPLLMSHCPDARNEDLASVLAGDLMLAVVLGRAPQPTSYCHLKHGRLLVAHPAIPFAAEADLLMVSAETESGRVIVLVDARSADIRHVASADPSVRLGSIALDVSVADTDIVAADGLATILHDGIEAAVRLMLAAELAGVVHRLVDMSTAYALTREQFGRPIAGFQAIRHLLAAMAVRRVALGNLCDAVLADADADASQVTRLGRIAKAYAGEVGRKTAEDSLQVHGGIGYTYEYPLHLYYRRALTLEGFAGEPDELYMAIGDAAVGSA
jgi:alkylation response protein AidB-like acyl-CoA dehydrogenase